MYRKISTSTDITEWSVDIRPLPVLNNTLKMLIYCMRRHVEILLPRQNGMTLSHSVINNWAIFVGWFFSILLVLIVHFSLPHICCSVKCMKLRRLTTAVRVSERRSQNGKLSAFLTLTTYIFIFSNLDMGKALIPYLEEFSSVQGLQIELVTILSKLDVQF